MVLNLVLLAAVLSAISGLLCLAAPRGGRWGDRLYALIMVSAGALGCGGALVTLLGHATYNLIADWSLPWGRFSLHLDALSAAFLLPVFLVPALASVYGAAYWREGRAPGARTLRVFLGVLTGSMALVTLARDGALFLIVWEVMALAAFFAIATEDTKADVRRSAWVYLIATHVGTLALLAMFALLHADTGSFDLAPLQSGQLSPAHATGVFVLALVGFGLKAGIMPLHVWLPGAHANAPSHVSAILSGVMLKMGVYGLMRMTTLPPEIPAWWGWMLVGLGAASAVLGIMFAIAQGDYKRMLAYSSIENIGVIVLGIGAALVGRASGDATLAALALAGAILHVWNHALFKPLLFFAAGSVLHATGTRRMNLLGGLAGPMPWTSLAACAGCIGICALPPLNGFISEWLLLRGFLHGVGTTGSDCSAALAAATTALAFTGTLAALAFVRFFATIFLGAPRSEHTREAHESPAPMLAPMALLAGLCAAIGVAPSLIVPALRTVVRQEAGTAAEQALGSDVLDPLRPIGAIAAVMLLVLGGAWALKRSKRIARTPRSETWSCGYLQPTPRMQYGESSLAQMLVSLFAWALLPRRRGPTVNGAFPPASASRTHVPDVVLDRALRPGLRRLSALATRLRLLQQGRIQIYVLYILLIVIILLLAAAR